MIPKMMAEETTKFWFCVHRFDRGEKRGKATLSVTFRANEESSKIRRKIKDLLEISDSPDLLFKLRNTGGALIPVNFQIQANTKQTPYTVEVVKQHQHVKPRERTVPLSQYNSLLENRLSQVTERVDCLEEIIPQLNSKRYEITQKELVQLDQKMRFLNMRIEQAGALKWQGMFKKHPMW